MLVIDSRRKKQWLNLLLKFIRVRVKGSSIQMARGSMVISDLTVGYGTRINGPLLVKGAGRASIGRYCAFGWDIKLFTSNHELTYANIQFDLQRRIGARLPISEKKDISIGHNVWIGDSAIILPGVSIGEGAVIGAGAIVTKDVPAYAVCAGNPAHFIKWRFSEEVRELLRTVQWWNWTPAKIANNRQLFETDLAAVRGDGVPALAERIVEG